MGNCRKKVEDALKAAKALGDGGDKVRIGDLHEAVALLAEAVASLPDWVLEGGCCPPGEFCCNCD